MYPSYTQKKQEEASITVLVPNEREKKLTPFDRQVCIHKDWWTKIIWNKDKECYYTNGLLKKLHNYDETDSEEESQDSDTEEPTVDQQIQQAPINPILKNSLLVSTMKLL